MRSKKRKQGPETTSKWKLAGASVLAAVLIHTVVGALIPSIDLIAAPLFCEGATRIKTDVFRPLPGETHWSRTVECLFDAGEPLDITVLVWPVTTLFMAVPIFIALLMSWGKDEH